MSASETGTVHPGRSVGSTSGFSLFAERERDVAGVVHTPPFDGFRESGSVFKEQGLDALRFYTGAKTVAVHYGS